MSCCNPLDIVFIFRPFSIVFIYFNMNIFSNKQRGLLSSRNFFTLSAAIDQRLCWFEIKTSFGCVIEARFLRLFAQIVPDLDFILDFA